MPETPRIVIDATKARSAIYKGRPLQEMTRDELIDVVIEMANDHVAEVNAVYYRLRDHIVTARGKIDNA